ncbi:MAG: hypothetical protein PHF84_02435 [bacterium]|nr:hypothetical protein [bacterium]
MKNKLLLVLISILLMHPALYSQTAHTNWSKLSKYLVLQPSLNISAWETRSLVTQMQAVGDGTYQVRMDLTPGQYYNFVFMAQTGLAPPPGLTASYKYYDQPPSTGSIPTSKTPDSIQSTNQAWYGSVTQSGDARRILLVPDLNEGESLYVFNNFNAGPRLPDRIEALANDQKVILSWSIPKGQWNWDDVNVMAGGGYYVYYNSTGPTNNYSLLAGLEGNVTSYTHTGLNNGTTYYYILVVSDAYLRNTGAPFENRRTALPPPSGKAPNAAYATPRGVMPVYFKVEKLDWEVVKEKDYLVWLTPSEEDARLYFNKTAGRIIKVNVR